MDGPRTSSVEALDRQGKDAEDERKKPIKFFVGGIRPDAWDDDLRDHFSAFGKVLEVQVMRDASTGRNRGFGFVTMEPNVPLEYIFRNTHIIKHKKVEVREMQKEGTSNLKRKMFVGGINPALNEDALHSYFSKFGTIDKVTIMRDLEGKSRGFGFVVFVDEDVVDNVLTKTIHKIDSVNKVEVRAAESRHKEKGMGRGTLQRSPTRPPPYAPAFAPGSAYAAYLSHYYGARPATAYGPPPGPPAPFGMFAPPPPATPFPGIPPAASYAAYSPYAGYGPPPTAGRGDGAEFVDLWSGGIEQGMDRHGVQRNGTASGGRGRGAHRASPY